MAMEPEPCHGVRLYSFEDCKCIIVMTEEVINSTAINRQGLIKMPAYHTRVLNVPGWSPISNSCMPIILIPLFISMPEDKIPKVPLHSRISILMESLLFSGPFGHIEAIKFSKSLKF